ncbi:MAG: glycosyltransferase [Patescibacteria group bacterium]
MAKVKASVILTVLNEITSIESTVQALIHQSHKSDEIIIVDAGSTDGTLEYLKKQKGIRLFSHPSNRSVGRNFAVTKSKFPILAFTDAGCIPEKDWLEELVKPFSVPAVTVVSGFYQGTYKNIFEKSQIPYVLIMSERAGKTEFFPSTRSMAIRKSTFLELGGFHPELNYSEDYEFAHRLKSHGHAFHFAGSAVVTWQPRRSLAEAFWMFLFFAIGDIKAGILRPKVKLLFIRYFVFFFLLFLLLELNTLYIIPYTLYSFMIYYFWSVAKNYKYVRDPRAFFWLPVLQFTSDASVILGSIIGMMSRQWAIQKPQPKA